MEKLISFKLFDYKKREKKQEIIDNKLVNAKQDDRIKFKCIICSKDATKTISALIKRGVDYREISLKDESIFVCRKCSTSFFLRKKHGVNNCMQIEEVKNKNVASRKKTYDELEFKENKYSLELIEKISGKKKVEKINYVCKSCGKEFKKERSSLTDDFLCKSCKQKNTMSKRNCSILFNRFKDDYEFLFDESLFTAQRDFNKNENILYPLKCKKCGTIFEAHFHSNVPRCPVCYPKYSSVPEKELFEYIASFGFDVKKNSRDVIPPLEIDVFVKNLNIGFELNGLYWHSELNGKGSDYHINKTKLAEAKGVKIIHIYEDEWLEKKDIVQSIIKNKLSIVDKKIGARETVIKEISSREAFEFYERNHISGGVYSKHNLGLFFEKELVSCLSFSSNRFGSSGIEMTRFANKINTLVLGSFSKLLKHFKKKYLNDKIVTYADIRFFDGHTYKKNGFIFSHYSRPNYYYLDKNYNIRYSRESFQKHKLSNLLESFDKNLTEWENMQINGYDRIWDCGNYVFESYIDKELENV